MSKINPENAKLRKLDTKLNYTNPNEEVSLVEKILGEEKCGKGMYWCNTDQVCKPLQGLKVPGQKAKPTETGIGKPVAEGSCTHTKKGKSCPVHGMTECPMGEAKDQKESSILRDVNGNVYVEFIDLINSGSIEEENPGLWANIHNRRKKGLPKKKPGQKGYPKTLDIEEGIQQAKKMLEQINAGQVKIGKS
jgi:hypothetical protein